MSLRAKHHSELEVEIYLLLDIGLELNLLILTRSNRSSRRVRQNYTLSRRCRLDFVLDFDGFVIRDRELIATFAIIRARAKREFEGFLRELEQNTAKTDDHGHGRTREKKIWEETKKIDQKVQKQSTERVRDMLANGWLESMFWEVESTFEGL